MLQTYTISGNIIYYDIERKTIARIPSKSNLLLKGADNSLYLGMKNNIEITKSICNIFGVSNIKKIQDLKFDLSFCGEIINVFLNINKDDQIQIRFPGDGTIGRIISKYSDAEKQKIELTSMLIVLDFAHCEIRIKNLNEIRL